MYQALYRKYRPQTFSDVVGQEHITETLKSQLSLGRVFHAYLFTGTRGTGKTSCAKILAKAVNCINSENGDPCLECEACQAIANGEVMDICEIDAASNNGIEDVRILREQVNFTPANAKYRVYIIDEVHMMSTSAFNALLKTIEEPPSHVIFILATTEVHKLPATIISRCERFDFKRIEPEDICKRLMYVCKEEGITLTENAARLIAAAADGGMRDALSILDLAASGKSEITEETVSEVCGMTGREMLFSMADAVSNRDVGAALSIVSKAHASSLDLGRFMITLASHYRDLLMIKAVPENPPVLCTAAEKERLAASAENYTTEEILRILKVLSENTAGASANRRTATEMMVIRLCSPSLCGDLDALVARISDLEKQVASLSVGGVVASPKVKVNESTPIAEQKPVEPKATEEEDDIPPPFDDADAPAPTEEEYVAETKKPVEKPIVTAESGDETVFASWQNVLEEVRVVCPLLVGVLEGSVAYLKGDSLLIDSKNPMFRSMLGASAEYRKHIKNAALKVTGKQYRLGPYERKVTEKQAADDPLAALKAKLDSIGNEIK